MPDVVELVPLGDGDGIRVGAESGKYTVEILPVEFVEADERAFAAADAFHGRLVFGAPPVGEVVRVDGGGMAAEERLGLPGHTAAPVDHCSEDVEDKCLDGGHLFGDYGTAGDTWGGRGCLVGCLGGCLVGCVAGHLGS